MRRKIVTAVLAIALVGVVGAEGIIKVRESALPKGTVTVEELGSVIVDQNRLDGSPVLAAVTTYRQGM